MEIHIWADLDEATREVLLQRPAVEQPPAIENKVREIIEEVRKNGDAALRRLTLELDGVELDSIQVTSNEMATAGNQLEGTQIQALSLAIEQVTRFHEAQRRTTLRIETLPGVVCESHLRPIESVGLYVPAGSAPLPSTAVMLAVPARLAGCRRRILCTPPRPDGSADPAIITAARMCGVETIFKLGGAQAIAAMCYGTETVPKAMKIFGPGNAWVAAAKLAVSRDNRGVAVDLPAGASEVLVIADEKAPAPFVAIDLLSQAEHGADSQAILLTASEKLAHQVALEVKTQSAELPRKNLLDQSLEHSPIIVVETLADAFEISNRYAPEHLIVHVENPRQWLDRIRNAGSVFLGYWSPVSAGDYCSGTNHVLPTHGFAHSCSALGVDDFEKRMAVQELTPDGLERLGPTIETLAGLEGFEAHARAVSARLAAAASS